MRHNSNMQYTTTHNNQSSSEGNLGKPPAQSSVLQHNGGNITLQHEKVRLTGVNLGKNPVVNIQEIQNANSNFLTYENNAQHSNADPNQN